MVLKVLIVEDEVALLENVGRFLTSFPGEFETVGVESAEAALDILREDLKLDMLLTDIRLPGIDGVELIRQTLDLRPEIAMVVMTAYGSPTLRHRTQREGAIRFLEKPLDLDSLRDTLLSVGPANHRRSVEIGGLSVCEVTEFVSVSGESKVLQFTADNRLGTLVFVGGDLSHCAAGGRQGADAFFEMALWGNGAFVDIFGADPLRFQLNVHQTVTDLLDEAERFREEVFELSPDEDHAAELVEEILRRKSNTPPRRRTSKSVADPTSTRKERDMSMKEHLGEFETIEGFQGAAVFTAQGEMIDALAKGKVDIKSIGMYANNALLNAQKATDQMGVGRGNLMQIRAPQATVLMRCLNEATDFAADKEGKAHFHAVVVMDPEGNTGMAQVILDKVVGKIADELR